MIKTPMTQHPFHRQRLLSQARDLFDFFGPNARSLEQTSS